MATGPTLPVRAIDILTPDLSAQEPFINQFWGPLVLGGVAFISVCGGNFLMKRPVFSGIQRHIALTALGAYGGKVLSDRKAAYLADRDAIYRHYIQLHPEDFPDLEQKKIGDIFEPWLPIR